MMDNRTGKVEMLDDELVRQLDAAEGRMKLIQAISEQMLPPRQREELSRTGHTKVGRNDPCPCGATKEDGKTRKKFKKCCLVKSSTVAPLVLDSGFGIAE